jgi:hypothetical protein
MKWEKHTPCIPGFGESSLGPIHRAVFLMANMGLLWVGGVRRKAIMRKA